jgi:hypothetical protein
LSMSQGSENKRYGVEVGNGRSGIFYSFILFLQ